MTDYADLVKRLRDDADALERIAELSSSTDLDGTPPLEREAADALSSLTRELEEARHSRYVAGMEEGARIADEYVRQEAIDDKSRSATTIVAQSIARTIRTVKDAYATDARLSTAPPSDSNDHGSK